MLAEAIPEAAACGSLLSLDHNPEAAACSSLLSLDHNSLVVIGEYLVGDHPLRLGALCVAHRTLDAALSTAEADGLWAALCRRHRITAPSAGLGSAKCTFGRQATTLCQDCHTPTRYEFVLLKCRLCERCERASPQRYAVATIPQLLQERSVVAELSVSQRNVLFARLPSFERSGYDWYLRQQATTGATALLHPAKTMHLEEEVVVAEPALDVSDAATVSVATAAGSSATTAPDQPETARLAAAAARLQCAGAPSSAPIAIAPARRQLGDSSGDDDDDEGSGSSPIDAAELSRAWDAAAADHTANAERRRPGGAQSKAERDEKKAHKRKVKAAQRERREKAESAVLPARFASSRGPAPGSQHKPKRTSIREHREKARPNEWEVALERLEAEFGADLCGLSGLVLATDD